MRLAVHIVAGGAVGVVAGVVDVDVAVSGIQDVVFADMVFRAEREPDAVAVGQAVHAVAGVFDGRAVKGRYLRAVAAGRSLGKEPPSATL